MKNSVVDELKKKFPNGNLIEFEDGEWAFFKPVSRKVLGLAMTKGRNNPIAMIDVIVTNCLVDTSVKTTFDDDRSLGYLMGLADTLDDLIGTKKAEIKN